MLINRHHVSLLIDLGAIAQGKTAQQLAPLNDRLDAFFNTLGGAASPAARKAYADRMQRLPKDDRPWSAVRHPDPGTHLAAGTGASPGGPPAALLVRGQEDDDPDGEEDGNRLPSPGTVAARPWAPLHEALERWDASEILRWVGPLGWQRPDEPGERMQDVELAGPPEPTSPGEAAARAAQEADARSRKTLRVVGIAAAAGGTGALLLGLGRALGRPAMTSQDALAGAKDDTP